MTDKILKELQKKDFCVEKVTIYNGNVALIKKSNENGYYKVKLPYDQN